MKGSPTNRPRLELRLDLRPGYGATLGEKPGHLPHDLGSERLCTDAVELVLHGVSRAYGRADFALVASTRNTSPCVGIAPFRHAGRASTSMVRKAFLVR